MVGCIIVNYRSPWEMLRQCLESVRRESATTPCRIVLVDNGSRDGVVDLVREEFPDVLVVEMPGNPGFAAAVNRGLEEISEPLVLMLNTDAVLTAGALMQMVTAMEEAGDEVAGVAPMMMSSSHPGIIDAIGIVIPPSGAAFNRGIGQCDLGQYDNSDDVAGVCFGAGLLRRSLFGPDRVGPLNEDYFLYFEDSDWCMRAVTRGYRFRTAPDAVVLHMHSGVTRNESLDFKYGLIELNTLKMVTRNFESRTRVAHIVSSRCLRLLARTFVRRKFIGPNLKTMAAYLSGLPQLLRERKELKSRRTVSDAKIFSLAAGENAWFDTVTYRPDRGIDSLIDTYLRLFQVDHDPNTGRLLAALYQLKPDAAGGVPVIGEEITGLFTDQPQCVRELLAASGAAQTP
ncbi:MAG: glycosyltransferase family 2 protein [Thermoleophilia bacterium]